MYEVQEIQCCVCLIVCIKLMKVKNSVFHKESTLNTEVVVVFHPQISQGENLERGIWVGLDCKVFTCYLSTRCQMLTGPPDCIGFVRPKKGLVLPTIASDYVNLLIYIYIYYIILK